MEFGLGDNTLFNIFVASCYNFTVLEATCFLRLHFNGYYKTSILFQKYNYHTFSN